MDAHGATITGFATEPGAEPIDDSLVLGLRALVTLAQGGPLDLAELARLSDRRAQRVAAVVGELERGGLVERLADPTLVAVTRRGAALVRGERSWLH